MNDEELDELCRRIYKNHRQALDLIWERVGSPESSVLVETASVLEQDPRWHLFSRANKYLEFVPKAWLESLPPFGSYDEDDPRYWIFIYLKLEEGRLYYTLLVGPMGDAAKRKEIVIGLRKEGPALGFKRSNASQVRTWARITAAETILEWGEDDEPEPMTIRESVKKKLDELYPKLEKLALVLKPLCNLPASAENSGRKKR